MLVQTDRRPHPRRIPGLLGVVLALSLFGLGCATLSAQDDVGGTTVIEVQWDEDGTLTVDGRGFGAGEGIVLTVTTESQQARVTNVPGVQVLSSQSSRQSSAVTLQADEQGTFRFTGGITAPTGAEVVVVAIGSSGASAEARTTR